MKKYFLSFVVFCASAFYVAYQYIDGTSVIIAGGPNSTAIGDVTITPTPSADNPTPSPINTIKSPLPSAKPTTAPQTSQTPTPTPKPKGLYKDGTYTSGVADAYYGNVQIQATISNGKLVNVDFLQYPSDRRTSININSQAMPLLKTEALQAQSANVSGVSGATATSQAFIQSLEEVLSQAKNI